MKDQEMGKRRAGGDALYQYRAKNKHVWSLFLWHKGMAYLLLVRLCKCICTSLPSMGRMYNTHDSNGLDFFADDLCVGARRAGLIGSMCVYRVVGEYRRGRLCIRYASWHGYRELVYACWTGAVRAAWE
jgi:hypothetical protein